MPPPLALVLAAIVVAGGAGCAVPPGPPEARGPEPEPGQGPPLALAAPERIELTNELQVWVVPSGPAPLVRLEVVVEAGSAADPRGKEGLAALTQAMLDEGAGARSALEIAGEIETLGAALELRAAKAHSTVSLDVLERHLEPALDILADVLLRPRFPEDEWERVHRTWLDTLAQRREEPHEVARAAALRAFYGEGHPYAHPESGYESSARAITLADVKAFYRRHYRPDRAVVLAVTRLDSRAVRDLLEARLGGWKAEGAYQGERAAPPLPDAAGPRLVLVDKPGAPQTEIRILVPAPGFGSPRAAPLVLANLIFGGTFTSRLMMNLRERQKLTYGARSAVAPLPAPAYLAAASAVHADRTGPALVELARELRLLATGKLEPGEAEKARATHRTRLLRAQETQAGLAALYEESAAFGREPEERRRFHERVLAAGAEEVSQAARETFLWERAVAVLVGDRGSIEKQLRPLRELPAPDLAGDPIILPEPEIRGREGEHVP